MGPVGTAATAEPGGGGQQADRAAAELAADPARSNRLIAVSAGIRPEAVAVVRRQLEAAGQIPAIPVADHAWRAYPAPPSHHRALDAIEQGAATSREVAELAGVSMSMAWRALKRHRPSGPAPAIVLGLIEQPPLEMIRGGLVRPGPAASMDE